RGACRRPARPGRGADQAGGRGRGGGRGGEVAPVRRPVGRGSRPGAGDVAGDRVPALDLRPRLAPRRAGGGFRESVIRTGGVRCLRGRPPTVEAAMPADPARVKTIFLAAVEKPAAERAAFLAEACPDAELRFRVDALLRAHDEPGDGPAVDSME